MKKFLKISIILIFLIFYLSINTFAKTNYYYNKNRPSKSTLQNQFVENAIREYENGGRGYKYCHEFGSEITNWCCFFVTYCMPLKPRRLQDSAGYYDSYAGCGDLADFYRATGQWRNAGGIPRRGDIVFFQDGPTSVYSDAYRNIYNASLVHYISCHVGIVVNDYFFGGNTYISVIEGNTLYQNPSNAVISRNDYRIAKGMNVLYRTNGTKKYILGYGIYGKNENFIYK